MRDEEFKECLDQILVGSYKHLKKLYKYFDEEKEGKDSKLVENRVRGAFNFFRREAEKINSHSKGFAPAVMGDFYYYGMGVEKDTHKACEYYEQSDKCNNPWGQTGLAWCYHLGYAPRYNDAKAVELFTKAANPESSNHPFAQYSLGYMYMFGFGVKQDREQALKWFRLAANQGGDNSCVAIGIMYQCGIGGRRLHAEAKVEFQRALKINPRNEAAKARLEFKKVSTRIDDLYQSRTGLTTTREKNSGDFYGYHVEITHPKLNEPLYDGILALKWRDALVKDEAFNCAKQEFNHSTSGRCINGLIWLSALSVVVGGFCIYFNETDTGIGLIIGGVLVGLLFLKIKQNSISKLKSPFVNKIAAHVYEKELVDLIIEADQMCLKAINEGKDKRTDELKKMIKESMDRSDKEFKEAIESHLLQLAQHAEEQPGAPDYKFVPAELEPGAEGMTHAEPSAPPAALVYSGRGAPSGLVQMREWSGMNAQPTDARPSAPLSELKDHVVQIPPRKAV